MSIHRVITKSAVVAPGAGPGVPGLYDAESVNRWRTDVDAAHARGETIIARLWHPVSALVADADAEDAMVDAYRVAAEGASDAGFDGVALADTPLLTEVCREQVI